MKPPQTYRFQAQNYPGAPEWFYRYLSDQNNFSEPIWNMVNKNITVEDNIDAQFFTFTIDAGAASTDNTVTFALTLKHIPKSVIIGNVYNTAAYSAPVTGVTLAWSPPDGNQLSITAIDGLTSGQQYSITVRVE